jgi:hypothetical protein
MTDKLIEQIKTGDPDPSAMENRILTNTEALKEENGNDKST